jgi:hypothetical protein
VKYTDEGGVSSHGNKIVKYSRKSIVEYIHVRGASCLGIGDLNISVSVL